MISALSVPMYADRAKIPQSRGPSLPKAHTRLRECPFKRSANGGNSYGKELFVLDASIRIKDRKLFQVGQVRAILGISFR